MLTVAFLLLLTAAPAVRSEAPVREVVLSDGTRRYGVPIFVGETSLEAGLDTGSSGLRLVPHALPERDARPTTRADTYAYGAGAKLDGVIGEATVAIGALKGVTSLQLVTHVGCTAAKPRCAAGSIPVEQYGIQGDGLPGEGFKAILGVNMASAEIPSLFAGVGARRWIVELPRPGEGAPGRIVLNPTDAETAGYVTLPVVERYSAQKGGLHDSLIGCLKNETTGKQVCGAVLLDSGAPGIRVVSPEAPAQPWGQDTPMSLMLADGSGHVKAVERLRAGERAQATRLTFDTHPEPGSPAIYAGLAPYFAFSVLYDPEHGTVSFKPRPAAPEGPAGTTTP